VSRRRRGALLGGLSLLLGGLAASDIGGREADLRAQVGPLTPVLVTRVALPAGARLSRERLALRRVPRRWAPAGAFASPDEVTGLRLAVATPAGADLLAAMVDDGQAIPGAPVRPGERVADIVAVGSPRLIAAGVHVDVVVTRADADGAGSTSLALENVEVLASRAAPDARSDDGVEHVAVSLRVTVRQAVYLGAAQSFAREIRLLPRAAGDDRRAARALSVGSSL